MNLALALLLGAASAPAAQPVGAGDRPLSPTQTFEGVYVTNFEISYFVPCNLESGGCGDWEKQESRWLSASDRAEDNKLNACMARWNGSRDQWGLFAIVFRGRETLDRRPKQTMHDTERHIFVDEVKALELVGRDFTWEHELPRYRRKPRMAC
jgi:hypothetical protein